MTPTTSEEQFKYNSGFGNEFATEAVEGALLIGRNSLQIALFRLAAQFGKSGLLCTKKPNKLL